jgi:hypothetical protein
MKDLELSGEGFHLYHGGYLPLSGSHDLSRISILYLLNVTLNPGGFLTHGEAVGIEGLPEGTRISGDVCSISA